MHFAAILEQRPPHWYIHVPSFDVSGRTREPHQPEATAVALVAAATGLTATEIQVSVHYATQGDTLVATAPSEVEVRHSDGVWRTASHTGWLRQRDGSWQALVEYVARGSLWTRAARPTCVRHPAVEALRAPGPRAELVPVLVAR